jgi:CDP-diacylglycerol--glycerol-3-phosphate 3-phosphatidyltransferase
MSNQADAMSVLRRQWWVTALLHILGLGLGYWALSAWWAVEQARLWLVAACGVAALILGGLRRNLGLNHRRLEMDLLPSLGAATALTLMRGLLLAFLAGFLLLPRPSSGLVWAPPLCYLSVALLDYADGAVARITHHMTLLGEKLDLDLDALGILIAPLLGVLYGQLPVWYLLVSASRYLFAAGLWLLKRQGRPVYNLTKSERRRSMAGFQMGLNVAVLLPFLGPPATVLAATLFMVPFLAGFLRDWLVVSGAVDPQSGSYQTLAFRSEQVFYGWLPILFRLGAGGLLTYFMLTGASAAPGHRVLMILFVCQIGLTVLILAGALGRLSALAALLATGLAFQGAQIEPPGIVLLILLLLVFLFGTGYYSLWQPEESFLRYHAGAKPRSPQ